MLGYALEHLPYKVGEKVAIAQRYIDLVNNDKFYRLCGIHGMPLEYIRFEKGCPHLIAVNVDSSRDAYIECDIDNEDIFKI